jgi:hypothetical protein
LPKILLKKTKKNPGSSKPLPVYLDESAPYHHHCLKCRKQYYLDNPERHQVSSLNEGTIIKSQVKKIYRLSTAALGMVPSIITTNSIYRTHMYIYRRSDLFKKVCEVHGGVVGLRSVSTIADSHYKIAESEQYAFFFHCKIFLLNNVFFLSLSLIK